MIPPDTDLLIRRMFRARKYTLIGGAVLIGLFALMNLTTPLCWDRDIGPIRYDVFQLAGLCLPIAVVVCAIVTCYYVYCVCYNEVGTLYALGHTLVCLALTPAFLVGPLCIPLLVQNDIERRRETDCDEETNESDCDCG